MENKGPVLKEMWERKYAARDRYEGTVAKTRGQLSTGTLPSYVHNPKTGILSDIESHTWAREDIPAVFDLIDNALKWAKPNVIEVYASVGAYGAVTAIKGSVLLPKSDVERLAEPIEISAGESVAIPKSASAGRPSQVDNIWDAYAALKGEDATDFNKPKTLVYPLVRARVEELAGDDFTEKGLGNEAIRKVIATDFDENQGKSNA